MMWCAEVCSLDSRCDNAQLTALAHARTHRPLTVTATRKPFH